MKFSKQAQSALAISKSYAEEYKCRYAGTEHLLLGLIECDDEFLKETFERLEVDFIDLKDVVVSICQLEENNKLKDKVRKLNDECAQLEDALHRHPDDY